MAVFILQDPLSVWTNLGKHLLFVWLFISSVKTCTRRIIRPDELSSVVRLEQHTTEDSSSGRIMRLLSVFTLETNNQTNNKCLPKFVQTHNWSSSIKTANVVVIIDPLYSSQPLILSNLINEIKVDQNYSENIFTMQ